MINRYWMIASLLATVLGTGCCYDQCGHYNSTTYDPCTGLVGSGHHGCFDKVKNVFKDDDDDDDDDDDHECDCHKKKKKTSCGCDYDHMMHGSHVYGEPHHGGGSDCPCNSNHGTPTFSGAHHTTQIYNPSGPSEVYVSPEEFDQIDGTPMPIESAQPMQPMKPVPAPAAEPEELPSESTSTIPPASYVVPAPLEGPSVPVLKPFEG